MLIIPWPLCSGSVYNVGMLADWQGYGLHLTLRRVMAQPRHGERWQRVAKRLENAHKSAEAILKLVAADILAESPP